MIPKENIISVSNCYGESITMTLSWDAGGNEWSKAFRIILYWLTYGEKTINEIVPDLEEIKDFLNETE